MDAEVLAQIEAVRHFNRFSTRQIGVLGERLLSGPHTLAQARVLFELGCRVSATAGEWVEALGLDPGDLSRILRRLAAHGLVAACQRSSRDARRVDLTLTPARGAGRTRRPVA